LKVCDTFINSFHPSSGTFNPFNRCSKTRDESKRVPNAKRKNNKCRFFIWNTLLASTYGVVFGTFCAVKSISYHLQRPII